MTRRSTALAARRHLATISESEVTAMRECDPDTLAALVKAVRTIAKDDDTREHACIIVASLRPGAADDIHAARAAVSIARRAVALSRSLDEWADSYGEMTEAVTVAIEDARTASSLTRYAPDPASRWSTSYGDLLATVVRMVPESRRDTLRAAMAAYLRHAATCDACSDAMAQRVTVAGVQAHVMGLDSSHAEFHTLRRAVVAAVESVPGRGTHSARCKADCDCAPRASWAWEALRLLTDDPSPMAPANVSHSRVSLGDCAPVSTRTYVAPVRTVWEEATREHVTTTRTTTRILSAPRPRVAKGYTGPLPGDERAEGTYRRACCAYDIAMRAARADHDARVGKRYTSPLWVTLDSLGYVAAHGYADAPLADAIATARVAMTDAERALVRAREDVTLTTTREYVDTRTTYGAPRAITEAEVTALRHSDPERGARFAGEEYGPSSAPNTRDLNLDGTLRAFPTVVSPRKKSGAGSTGPTVRGF